MSDKPTTQQSPQNGQQTQQPLSWDKLGQISKEEYEARRPEIQRWIRGKISYSGRVLD